MPLPPHIAIPASRASAATRSASNGMPGSGGSASYSDENVTADAGAGGDRIAERLLDPLVRDAEDRQVDRLGHVGDRGIAAEALRSRRSRD